MLNLANFIEHTNLAPTLTASAIDKLVAEAIEYQFLGVCVPPFWVKRAQREVGREPVKLITVAGFPLGYCMTETKLDEIKRAIDNGADEVDIVLNISAFKTNLPWTKIDVAKCCKLAHEHEKLLKVILETAYLNEEEIKLACELCADAGADFVKTSTGFAARGASVEDIVIMKQSIPAHVGIKASGGIKTAQQAHLLINAGATRIGTSSGVQIIQQELTNP